MAEVEIENIENWYKQSSNFTETVYIDTSNFRKSNQKSVDGILTENSYLHTSLCNNTTHIVYLNQIY